MCRVDFFQEAEIQLSKTLLPNKPQRPEREKLVSGYICVVPKPCGTESSSLVLHIVFLECPFPSSLCMYVCMYVSIIYLFMTSTLTTYNLIGTHSSLWERIKEGSISWTLKTGMGLSLVSLADCWLWKGQHLWEISAMLSSWTKPTAIIIVPRKCNAVLCQRLYMAGWQV